jgi:hypothetical protein
MSTLMQREARNWQFDFMKPTHPLFHYFTTLVDQYHKVYDGVLRMTDRVKVQTS